MTSTTSAVEPAAPPSTIEEIDAAVLDIIGSDTHRTWRAEAVIDATGLTMIETLVALARLTHTGQIERTGPGQYRHPNRPADETAARMRRRVLGDR